MSPASKLSALAAILLADLLFFLFFVAYYPEILEALLRQLPWDNNLEKAVIVISGFVIGVLTSTAIVNVLIKNFMKTAK